MFGAVPWPTRRQLLVAFACGCGASALLRRMRSGAPALWQQLVACGAAAARGGGGGAPWGASPPPALAGLVERRARVTCVVEPKVCPRLRCAMLRRVSPPCA